MEEAKPLLICACFLPGAALRVLLSGPSLAAAAKFWGEDCGGLQVWARRSPSAAGRAQRLKGSCVLTSACARGSKTGKCRELFCMKTTALLSLPPAPPTPQLHFIIQLLHALAASWSELSTVHCWLGVREEGRE